MGVRKPMGDVMVAMSIFITVYVVALISLLVLLRDFGVLKG